MSKKPISFRIRKEVLDFIRQEANNKNKTLSAVIEERLDPYSDIAKVGT